MDGSLDILLTVTAGECNGLMSLELNGDLIDLNLGSNLIHISSNKTLTIKTNGKDMSKDTKIADGKIIKDKHIEVTRIVINGIDFKWHDINDLLFSPYIGENKKIEIDLPTKANLIDWYLSLKEKFYASQLR